MEPKTVKRLYQVTVGYDILVAIDEFDSLTDLVNQNINEITAKLSSETCSGIYSEMEVESQDDVTESDHTLTPYTMDSDSRTVIQYLKELIQDQLEPCPFCGSTHVELCKDPTDYWVQCHNCMATGPSHPDPEDAKESWKM